MPVTYRRKLRVGSLVRITKPVVGETLGASQSANDLAGDIRYESPLAGAHGGFWIPKMDPAKGALARVEKEDDRLCDWWLLHRPGEETPPSLQNCVYHRDWLTPVCECCNRKLSPSQDPDELWPLRCERCASASVFFLGDLVYHTQGPRSEHGLAIVGPPDYYDYTHHHHGLIALKLTASNEIGHADRLCCHLIRPADWKPQPGDPVVCVKSYGIWSAGETDVCNGDDTKALKQFWAPQHLVDAAPDAFKQSLQQAAKPAAAPAAPAAPAAKFKVGDVVTYDGYGALGPREYTVCGAHKDGTYDLKGNNCGVVAATPDKMTLVAPQPDWQRRAEAKEFIVGDVVVWSNGAVGADVYTLADGGSRSPTGLDFIFDDGRRCNAPPIDIPRLSLLRPVDWEPQVGERVVYVVPIDDDISRSRVGAISVIPHLCDNPRRYIEHWAPAILAEPLIPLLRGEPAPAPPEQPPPVSRSKKRGTLTKRTDSDRRHWKIYTSIQSRDSQEARRARAEADRYTLSGGARHSALRGGLEGPGADPRQPAGGDKLPKACSCGRYACMCPRQ